MALLLKRFPIASYLVLAYVFSWGVWCALPAIVGTNWTLLKIFVVIGMGPGLAAVLLDRMHGTAGRITSRWWMHFAFVFLSLLAINISSLITGDARLAEEFAKASAPGVTTVGVFGSVVAAAVCAFIFASAAASERSSLNSIATRLPLKWCAIAVLLPAALLLASYAIALITREEMPPSIRAGLPLVTWLGFVTRAALFTLLAVAIGEETGWRGWLLPHLQQRVNPLNASLITGVVWGFWHFPLWLIHAYPGAPDGVVEYLFIGPLVAILFTWIVNRSGGSLAVAVLLHTAINSSQRLLPTTLMFPIFLTALVVTVIFTERMWRRRGDALSAAYVRKSGLESGDARVASRPCDA
ncbi:MAG TPA: CPBP family intramembrane glutamic endopeptidase [Thermoanaerobaculia bacterium]|nr:CPBP family intramembrane glutamic endopeptidase [Thermoanaerobaculia bacterium]